MSRPNTATTRSAPQKPTTIARNPRDQTAELLKLRNHLHYLRDKILPKQPYLVSVPSDVPYRHSSRFVQTWHYGTPFAREEEQLQYTSFLPHQEAEESLLSVVGGWCDENGEVLEEKEESPRVVEVSGQNTPAGDAGRRKKISLNQYKKKGTADAEPVIEVTQPRDLEKQADKANVTDTPEVKPVSETKEVAHETAEPKSRKRSRADDTMESIVQVDGSSMKGEPIPNPMSLRPEKRRKLESPNPPNSLPTSDVQMEEAHVPDDVQPAAQGLPQLLSPSLPAKTDVSEMPRRLSTTLPLSVAEFLEAEVSPMQADVVLEKHRTDSVRSILAAANLEPSSQPSLKTDAGLTAEHAGRRVRSSSQHSAQSTHSTPASTVKVASAIRTPLRPSTPLGGARASPGPRQRHTIILKYGKRNRKRVEALLKFPSRPKKPDYRPPVVSTPERSAVDDKTPSSGKLIDKKHIAEGSPDVASKRRKATSAVLASSEGLTTPVPAESKSPSLAGRGKNLQPDSTHVTPKKELKSSAMARVLSAEDMEARTPTNDRASYSTPRSSERVNGDDKQPRPPTSAPSSREDEKLAWKSLAEKHYALGRLLKKEGSSVGPDSDAEETRHSILALIEALLCFMANTAAQGYVSPHSDPGWRTIVPFHIFVFRASRKIPRLHGLVVQLGAVCRQVINKYDMDRLAREPLPDEQCGSAPTPGSDGNTRTNEDGEKYKKKYLEFRDQLVLNSRELQNAWLTGAKLLSSEVIKNDFPKTWGKRGKDSSLRGTEKMTPGKLDGTQFFLPLDATTTAFEAVTFALAFMEEWAGQEGVEWKARLEL